MMQQIPQFSQFSMEYAVLFTVRPNPLYLSLDPKYLCFNLFRNLYDFKAHLHQNLKSCQKKTQQKNIFQDETFITSK